MRRRRLTAAMFLVVFAGLWAWANVPPTMDDQYVVTVRDVPVSFEIRAIDEDIDPFDASSETLRFALLDGPSHGVLIGDIEDIDYESPHAAVARLIYEPSRGFVGTDQLVLSVVDAHGEAAEGTTTILIDVTAERVEGLLSGNWSTEATFDVQTGEFTVFRTQFTEVYRIDRFSLQGTVDWKMQTQSGSKAFVLDALRFTSDVSLGDFDIGSTLEFDPEAAASGGHLFDYWRTTTSLAFLGLRFCHVFYLTLPMTSSYQTITVQGGLGAVSVSNALQFELDDDCGFVPARNDTHFAWRWWDLSLSASLTYTDLGFDRGALTASGIPIPGLLWFPGDISLGVTLSFEPEGKSLSAQLSWAPSRVGCLWVMGGVVSESETYAGGKVSADRATGLRIYGLKVECEVSAGIRFVSATSFDDDYNSTVTGLTDYFEAIRLSGDLVGCCGIPGYWGISTYFDDGSDSLFDWGMTAASFDVGLSEQFSFSFDLIVHSGNLTETDPWAEITVGWTARW